MPETIARDAFYDLVWSAPMTALARRFGVTQHVLTKACERHQIPAPKAGHWSKRNAGKPPHKIALEPRSPGHGPELFFDEGRLCPPDWRRQDDYGLVPLESEFPETVEDVRKRVVAKLGVVECPAAPILWHPVFQKVRAQQEARHNRLLSIPKSHFWDPPLLEIAVEQRRFRLLNSLFLATGTLNGKPKIYDHEAKDLTVAFDNQYVSISLDAARSPKAKSSGDDGRLQLSIRSPRDPKEVLASWVDTPLSPLENQLSEIACEIAMEAETRLRELGAAQRAQRVRHNAWLAGEAQKRALERAARHTEMLKRAESARVTALLEAAEAFRKASEIRALVKGMGERLLASGAPLDQRFLHWTDWALAEADKVDPCSQATLPGETPNATSAGRSQLDHFFE